MKKDKQITAFIGKDTEFEGKLTFHGSIRIDGHFKGEIFSDGDLIIGQEGIVEAEINVSSIVIIGEVHGDVIARQRIEIRASGKVFGNIQAPSVGIEEGAVFRGKVQMSLIEGEEEKKLTVITSDESPGGPSGPLGRVYGTVADRGTGERIKNAEVKAECKNVGEKSTRTNGSGHYELNNLRDGKWKLKIKAKGCEKRKATVEVSGGGTYKQNFE